MNNKLSTITRFLFSPFPAPGSDGIRKGATISFLSGIFILLFLYFFRPLDMGTSDPFILFKLACSYAMLTSLVILLYLVILPLILPKIIQDKHWHFIWELVYILFMILTIAFVNFIFTVIYFENVTFSIPSFINMIFSTLTIAVIPTVFFVSLDLVRHETRYQKDRTEVTIPETPEDSAKGKMLRFESDYDEPAIDVVDKDFLFAEADANYVSFYINKNNTVERILLRTSLKKVEAQIADHDMILRTHRSFIINLNNLENFHGNAQGYTIQFPFTEVTAKVSRSYTKTVKSLLNKA